MASKTPTYGKDLPGNLGTEGVLRAIYDKMDDGQSSDVIEQKLDTIISLTGDVNNNIQINTEAIKENTQAIKDISINIDFPTEDLQNITNAIDRQTQVIIDFPTEDLQNIINAIDRQTEVIKDASLNVNVDVKVDTGKICDSIDTVNESINSGFNRTIRTIKETRPHPEPVPPCPPPKPHPCPCPPIPEPIYDCYHHYLPNDSYFHNLCIQSDPNLTIEQKAYLEEVYRGEHKFDPKEYYLLPHYVPCVGLVNDVYNNMIYDL